MRLPENVNFCGLKPTLLFQVAFAALCRKGYLKREARQAILRPAYPLYHTGKAGGTSVPQAGYLKRKQGGGEG